MGSGVSRWGGLTCATVLLAACGAIDPAAGSTSTPWTAPQAQYLGPIQTNVDYGGPHHVHLAPPHGVPAIPWTSALNDCSPFCAVAETQAPVVELVSYTDDQYTTDTASGSRRVEVDVLAYAVIWHGVKCLASSVPYGGPTPNPQRRCMDYYFVDAMTGQHLPAYQQTES